MPDNKLDHSLLVETAIDIALNAGRLIAESKIAVSDSRELVQNIKTMARTFEQSGYDRDDYIGAVDAFSEEQLMQNYGILHHEQDFQSYDEIYLLYSCNEWKEYGSMRLIAATTDQNTLYPIIANEVLERRMDYEGESGKAGLVRYRQDYKKGHIDFGKLGLGFVQEMPNEQIMGHVTSTEYEDTYDWLHMDDGDFERLFSSNSSQNEDCFPNDGQLADYGLEP